MIITTLKQAVKEEKIISFSFFLIAFILFLGAPWRGQTGFARRKRDG
jgi:hypothetical protein